jgi:hypothetical protein
LVSVPGTVSPTVWTWVKVGPVRLLRGSRDFAAFPLSITTLVDGLLVTNSPAYVPPTNLLQLPK